MSARPPHGCPVTPPAAQRDPLRPPLRIAMIGQKGMPATYGGIERHVEEISARLVDRGHEVTVYSRLYYSKQRGSYHGIRLRRLPSVNTKHFDTATHTALATFDALIRPYDIVHFHALGPSIFSGIPRLRGMKSVVTVHGLDWERQKWGPAAAWLLKQCEYPAIHFPTSTIVVSRTLSQYFDQKFGLIPQVIPNGTGVPIERAANKIRRFGLGAEHGRYVLFVGRLVPEKGCHFLLEAFSQLQDRFPDVKLVMAGGSSFSDSYVHELKRYESDRILFLDYVYGDVLEELWSNAYLVVQPSTVEGLSLTLLEALSYGRCVLTSDIPENIEVTGDDAVAFRRADVGDLRQQLERLLAEPERVKSYEARARRLVKEQFSWDHVVDRVEAVYYQALAGVGTSRRARDPR